MKKVTIAVFALALMAGTYFGMTRNHKVMTGDPLPCPPACAADNN